MDFLKKVGMFLPSKIERVSWDGEALELACSKLLLRTESTWRISQNNQLILACWDRDSSELGSRLSGKFLTGISWLIADQPIDLSLKLSDGSSLDIFCCSSVEAWMLEIKEIGVYFGGQ